MKSVSKEMESFSEETEDQKVDILELKNKKSGSWKGCEERAPCRRAEIPDVSLMDRDMEVLGNLLAHIIPQYAERVTQHDQVGITQKTSEWLNIQRSVNVMQHTSRLKNNQSNKCINGCWKHLSKLKTHDKNTEKQKSREFPRLDTYEEHLWKTYSCHCS